MFNLTPWKRKSKEVERYNRGETDFFDRFMSPGFWPASGLFGPEEWFPAVDVSEGKKEVTVRAEIPGMDSKDLDLSLEGRYLTIKGEKQQEKEESDENWHRKERSYGSFMRTVELPTEVDAEKVDASYKKGVLKVVLKKTKESEQKRITVNPA
jgi:HSP20 family protein